MILNVMSALGTQADRAVKSEVIGDVAGQGKLHVLEWQHGSTCVYIEISENSLHGNFT